MYSRSEIERVWTDAYKKALSRGQSINKARESANFAAAEARAHGAEGPIRGPRTNQRVNKVLAEQAKRAKAAEALRENAPELTSTDLRKQMLERNKLVARRWANNLSNVTPMNRLRLQKNMLESLNKATEARLKSMAERPAVPFERWLAHREISDKVSVEIAKRLAGPTQWKNFTPAQRKDAIDLAYHWEQRVREQDWAREPEYELRNYTAKTEAERRLSEQSLHKRISQMTKWSANEAGERGLGELAPVEKTPFMSAKEMDREIFKESVKRTGAKLANAGRATTTAIKSGAKLGGRALARLGSAAVAGPVGAVAMGALTGWDIGNMIYDTAKEGEGQMKSAQGPLAQAGIASLAALTNMLVNSAKEPIEDIAEEVAEPIALQEDLAEEETPSSWNNDAPIGFGPISDWNDIADTVLGNTTGQGIEGEPDPQTANEIVEAWARAYEGEIKKEPKDTAIESASPFDWLGGQGWDWANQMAQDRPAEEIADAFDPWSEFNPRDQSSLEAHGADIGRGLGGSADEELKELMTQTSFLQKIADNTKEDEIAVLGV